MNCPKCKSEIPPGLKKCPECESRIKSDVARLEPLERRSDIPALELTNSEVVIGRLGDSDLILPGDSGVSGRHARIRRKGDHYFIEDNKSRHGVEVNGQKIISSFRLKAGDVITIGKFRFRFVTPQSSLSVSVTSPEVEVDHLRLLLDVTKLINSPLDLKDVLEHVIDSVIRVTHAERGFLMMVNEAGELEFKVARNLDRTEVEVEAGKVKLSFSTVEHVRKTGAPRVLVDIPEAKATEVGSSIHALGLRSIMCVPLKVEDRLIGVIYVDSQRKVEAFSQVDLWLFESLASQAALVIEKRQLYEQLQRYSSSLEDQVRERTADLARANDDLREAYSELEQAQSQVVQAEKMAALGKLSAGLAHELNNPAAAAGRAASQLVEALDELQSATIALIRAGLEHDLWDTLTGWVREFRQRSAGPLGLSPLELNDREEELLKWLDAHGVDEGWAMASTLVTAGIESKDLDTIAAQLPADLLGAVMLWLCRAIAAHDLAGVVGESTRNISNFVNVVKSYSYMDRAPLQYVDIHAGLEDTITILRHKLKRGIEVVRQYDRGLPPVHLRGGELNQVWTNLIDNAIGGIGEKGTITIRTYRDGDHVAVDITDDGPGIPKEIQPRIFDPFFTTKDVGQGTGLGLDVVRRIVSARAGWQIDFRSRPGETVFRVRVPVESTSSAGA